MKAGLQSKEMKIDANHMKSFLALLLAAIIVYIVPLNSRPMSVPDESRYAEIPREMITAGNWVVPYLNGLRYFEKPAMGYWINALSILAFGENNFAIRLPSAISTLITALFIFLLVRKFSGDTRKGILSSAAFLTCAEVFGIGVFCVLDSLLSMFITGTMVSFFMATQEIAQKRRIFYLILAGTSCGCAFLTKGFLGFALPVVGIIPFLIWERRFKDILHLAWIPAISALILILPWAITIHIQENDFWHYFFWVEHIQRFFASADEAQHPAPIWYFVPFIVGGIFPWTMLLPTAAAGLRKVGVQDPLTKFTICWFLFFLLFLSASSGKLATYILPCFPPLLILFISGLLKQLEDSHSKVFFCSAILTAVFMAAASLFLVTSQRFDCMEHLRVYWDHEAWKWRILAAGFAIFSIFSMFSSNSTGIYRQITLYAVAPLFLFFSVHFAVPQNFRFLARECMDPIRMIQSQQDRIKLDSIIVSDSYLAPAVCWAYKRKDVYILDKGGEFSYGLKYTEAKHRHIMFADFRYFSDITKDPVTLITEVNDYDIYKHQLPNPFYLLNTNGFVFAQYKLKEIKRR